MSLDASRSRGPEGVALEYRWNGIFGSAAGVKSRVNFPLGTSTVTLTVSDGRRSAQDTQQVSVQIDVTGFAAPLAALVEPGQLVQLPSMVVKKGRTLPLKLMLHCGATALTSAQVSAPHIVSIEWEGSALPLTTLDVDAGQSNDKGYAFRAGEGQWLYNLDTAALGTGTYRITVALPDGRHLVGGFVLR